MDLPEGTAAVRRLDSLAPVGRETMNERVYSELRRSLIHGVFEAGEVLRIAELAETMQTSTMPVREALARLVSERALEALPSRSVRVPLITPQRLDDLAHARRLVEGELVRLALPKIDTAELSELRALTRACEAAFASEAPDRAQSTSELNHAFHFRIYRAARSAVLIPIVESLWLQSGPYVRAAARIHQEEGRALAVHHHWALVAALESRDADRAVAALEDDITHSFNLIRRRLDAAGRSDRQERHG